MGYDIKLKASDIALMTVIIRKLGWTEIKKCFSVDNLRAFTAKSDDGSVIDIEALGTSVGLDVIGIILDNYAECDKELYKFLASASGMKANQVADLPLADFAELIAAVVQCEDFANFFSVVSRLIK